MILSIYGLVALENLTVLLSDTSKSTIRRDLDELAADGQLKRVDSVLKVFMV